MKEKHLKEIAESFNSPGPARLTCDENGRLLVQTTPWNWVIDPVEPPPPTSRNFGGQFYKATPDVFTSGGAGLRPRLFAIVDDRVLSLNLPQDMRYFLNRYVSSDDPLALATFLEQCQGKGRMAHIYRTDGKLERYLDAKSRHLLEKLKLSDPRFLNDTLEFFSWQITVEHGQEKTKVDRWTLQLNDPMGPTWSQRSEF